MTRRSPQAVRALLEWRRQHPVMRRWMITTRPGHLFQPQDALNAGYFNAFTERPNEPLEVMNESMAMFSRAWEWQMKFQEYR